MGCITDIKGGMTMPYTSEVFGINTKINDYSYVDRNNLDKQLQRYLRRNTHIAIKGPSKCGKSWLRQKCMENAVVIQCRIDMTAEDIYKAILSIIGATFDVLSSSTTTTCREIDGSGTVKVPFIADAKLDGKFAIEHVCGHQSGVEYSSSSSNLEYIAAAIKKTGRRVVIEDFHYLDLSARKKLAHDLKTLWDYQCYFIIIGVWTQTNLLTSMNSDLSGRIEEISISWNEEALRQVIINGSLALNIEIDAGIQEDLISDSFGNVGILQALLLRLVEDQADIESEQKCKVCICKPEFYSAAARAYASQLDGLYQQFAKILSTGIRRRKKSTGIYALAMEAIVNAPDDKLMYGYSRAEIFEITNAKEPRIKKGNLKTVLGKLVDLQCPAGERKLVISYDDSIDAVFAVDLQLLFYRKHHTMQWPWEEMLTEAKQYSLFEDDEG